MADPVAAVTEAPKKAFRFAENNVAAFLVIAVVLLLAYVAVEARRPGFFASKVVRVPGLGPIVLNQRRAA